MKSKQFLKIQCAPITWPIGMGKHFKGIYHLYREDCLFYMKPGKETSRSAKSQNIIKGLDNPD